MIETLADAGSLTDAVRQGRGGVLLSRVYSTPWTAINIVNHTTLKSVSLTLILTLNPFAIVRCSR